MALWLLSKAPGWPSVWREWGAQEAAGVLGAAGLAGWEQSVLLTGVRLHGCSRVFCVTPWEVSGREQKADPR